MTQPPYQPADPDKLKTYSIRDRRHKVQLDSFARLPDAGVTVLEWLQSLPDYLAVKSLRSVVQAIAAARGAGQPVVWALGAHMVKVGCSPVVIDLIDRGVITALAFNGATAVHDVEVATFGATSEEVAETIRDGSFGMVEETPHIFSEACKLAVAERTGMGAALGKLLDNLEANHADRCILVAAHRKGIPVTVHVAIGTDTIHMHASANGAMIGQASMNDFRLICGVVEAMAPKAPNDPAGVWCNIGSSVLLPEVFLKAVAVARNLGANLDAITTVNLDMIRHYRPTQNVLQRPVQEGRGFDLTGHHEIMLPLLRQAILETME